MKTIIINATATKSSGALTILKSFLLFIETSVNASDYHFYLFTTLDLFTNTEKITIENVNVKTWKQRIRWDNGGLKEYCEKNGIKADLIFSNQNTCTKWSGIPQLVYYHQALALIPFSWNPLKKSERLFWFYRHVYPFFVSRNNKSAKYIVQLNFIKTAFCNNFREISPERIYVVKPDFPNENINKIDSSTEFSDGRKVLLYPAVDAKYKNHRIILKALQKLTCEERNDVHVLFTVPSDSRLTKLILKYGLSYVCTCIGMRPYSELKKIYKIATAMIYPSKIESYGLPLIEAASFGIPILAADLTYAREVLKEYPNALFIDVNNADEWSRGIRKSCSMTKIPVKMEKKESSWNKIMKIIDEMILESKS